MPPKVLPLDPSREIEITQRFELLRSRLGVRMLSIKPSPDLPKLKNPTGPIIVAISSIGPGIGLPSAGADFATMNTGE